MKTPLHTFRLTLAALLVVSVNATAQDRAGGMLEEVVVTAQKRTESLTDVPISIAVMGSEAIMKTGVRQMREVAEFIPNMSISGGNDSTTAVRIRGVGANTRNIGFDTRAGVYVDGVYMGQSPAQNVDILDLERIEVARGPQGTLFGKNTVAGAINMI
ncbi:MAG: TonB-dependent receptor plug domain-containing protein, partial [Haliea sp.]